MRDGGHETETVYVEAIAGSLVAGDISFTLAAGPPSAPPATDTAKATALKLELDAMTVNHNAAGGALDNAKEETDGAFVPVNNDDDDYDAANNADKDQTGAITGEDDLLPVVLSKVIAADPGNYRLDIPGGFRVWKNVDRSDEVTAATDIAANADTTLYVEATAKGTGVLKLNWSNGARTFADADRVKLTAFEWSGPLNVPGYSIYNYKADGALAGSKWVTPGDGTIKTGANTSDVTILWGEGPVVGKAIYEVNDKFTWDLGVNVVQVKLKAGATNKIDYHSNPTQTAGTAQIQSATPGTNVIESQITIERIEGPVVGGTMRGLKFIEIGFIQNVRFTKESGDFNQLPKAGGAGNGRRRVASIESSNYVIDYVTSPARSTVPWYDSNNATGVAGGVGYFKPAASANAAIADTVFDMSDAPRITGSDLLALTEGSNTDDIDAMNIVFDANLYLAVRTTQAVNGSETKYTQRASATWTFNGSGSMAAGIWTAAASAGTSGSGSLTEVTSGDLVPVTTGTPANDLLAAKTWSTVNQ